MSPEPPSPITPVATVAARVKELRGRRGWTAARLGEELENYGLKWDRFTVASLESGKRQNVTVNELLALSLALGVAPVNLLVPVVNDPYQVVPGRVEDADAVRAWVRGEQPLYGDERTYRTEVSEEDHEKHRWPPDLEAVIQRAVAHALEQEGRREGES